MTNMITKEVQDKARDASHALGRAELLFKAAYIINMNIVEPGLNQHFDEDTAEIVRELLGTGISLIEGLYGAVGDVSVAIGFEINTDPAREHRVPPQLTEPRARRAAA